MSKRIDAKITCPKCGNQFDFKLYRSIWGEYPENRELVMTDKINVATCNSCNHASKIEFPFIYTNAIQNFAVWWEPEFDSQIDKDSQGYAQMMGEGNYLASAPRIKSWAEFKNTILKFENGILKGKPAILSKDSQDQLQGFVKQIATNQKKRGCLSLIIILLVFTFSMLFGISTIIFK